MVLPRQLFVIALSAAFLAAASLLSGCERSDASPRDLPEVTVYKSPTCGCCVLWAEYMEAEGFPVRQIDVANIGEVRASMGVPATLGSCHTAIVDGYVVEGHVPAEDVRRLLQDRPEATGIAVPGMPIGSPGMEVPGRTPQAYEVYLFASDGRQAVFARH